MWCYLIPSANCAQLTRWHASCSSAEVSFRMVGITFSSLPLPVLALSPARRQRTFERSSKHFLPPMRSFSYQQLRRQTKRVASQSSPTRSRRCSPMRKRVARMASGRRRSSLQIAERRSARFISLPRCLNGSRHQLQLSKLPKPMTPQLPLPFPFLLIRRIQLSQPINPLNPQHSHQRNLRNIRNLKLSRAYLKFP